MLSFLGTFEPAEAERRFGYATATEQHYWTCSNHDRATGNCAIYDTRPRMCKEYPYGRPCGYIDCTQKDELVQIRLHK